MDGHPIKWIQMWKQMTSWKLIRKGRLIVWKDLKSKNAFYIVVQLVAVCKRQMLSPMELVQIKATRGVLMILKTSCL